MKMERYLLICVIVLSVLSLIVGLFFMNRIKDTILSHLPKSWRKEEKLYRYVNDDGNVYLLPEDVNIFVRFLDRSIARDDRKIKISREISAGYSRMIQTIERAEAANQVPNSTIQSVQVQDQDNLFRGDV